MLLNSTVTPGVLLVTIKWRIGGYWKPFGSSLGRFNPTLLSEHCKIFWSITTCLSLLLLLSHKVQSCRVWELLGEVGMRWEEGRESPLLSNSARAPGRGDGWWKASHRSLSRVHGSDRQGQSDHPCACDSGCHDWPPKIDISYKPQLLHFLTDCMPWSNSTPMIPEDF